MHFKFPKTVRLIWYGVFFMCLGFQGLGQENMAKFLDSLDQQQRIDNFESKVGDNVRIKGLLQRIDTTEKSLKQVDHILKYAASVIEFSDFDSYTYLTWANSTIKLFNDQERETKILISLGVSIHNRKPIEALKFYEKAKAFYVAENNTLEIINMNKRIGLCYYTQKRFDKALEVMFRNMELFKSANNTKELLISYHNIGDSFMRIFDTENAIKYLKMSSELEDKLPDNSVRAMNLSFLGELYLMKDSLTIAKTYLEKANDFIRSTGELPYLLPDNTRHLGIIEEKRGNLKMAYANYKKAFEQAYPVMAAQRSSLLVSTRMAKILMVNKEYQEVITLLSRILKKKYNSEIVPTSALASEDIVEFYQTLGEAYQQIGDSENAAYIKNKELQTWQKSSISKMLINSKKIENQYQSELAAQQLQRLQDEKELRESRFTIGIISLVSLALILVLLTVFFKQRSESNKRQQTLTDLALQNEKIKSSALEKESKIATLEFELEKKSLTNDLRNKISADLHDEVGTLLTGLAMQSEILERKVPKANQEKLHRISALSREAMLGMRDSVWAMDAQKDFSNSLVDRMNEFANEQLENTGIHLICKPLV